MTDKEAKEPGQNTPVFRTVAETARDLRLCDKQVRRLIRRGELPAYRFGTALRRRREDIESFIWARRMR